MHGINVLCISRIYRRIKYEASYIRRFIDKLFLNNFFKLAVIETYEVLSNKKGKVIFDILKVLISYSRGAEASMLHR